MIRSGNTYIDEYLILVIRLSAYRLSALFDVRFVYHLKYAITLMLISNVSKKI